MKLHYLFLFLLACLGAVAQPAIDYSVRTWAEVDSTTPAITIHWKPINNAERYFVFKKSKKGSAWRTPIAQLQGDATMYRDTNVDIGVSYEYQIRKTGTPIAYGYINVGIQLPPVHYRGKVLLLAEEGIAGALSQEIEQLTEDLVGDGWGVVRRDIHRDSSVAYVKQITVKAYEAYRDIRVVFCLGHIPVPYSGNLNPDGHGNHQGAWPADGFYADINGKWTDTQINNTTASQMRNHNVPGDGKYDQYNFPSTLELQVGRVDFDNMPAFSLSETELLRRYLSKDHRYRMAEIRPAMRGVIDDNFGGFRGEAFAASAWKSFAPMLHPDSVAAGDYRMSMDTASYVWSYGCGGGSYTSCSGVGTTADLAGDSLRGIFSCLFGSYFGDWDSKNNILRAPLAQGTVLTNCWSGRPHWYFHHMAMGENIGYSARVNMNNKGLYNTPLSFLANIVSMGLMGDPTLRLHMVAPATGLTAEFNGFDVQLNWAESPDSVLGYYLYRSYEPAGPYTLLNTSPVRETSYTDACVERSGRAYYMVRAVVLQQSPSGSYYNLSQGDFAEVETALSLPTASFTADVQGNEATMINTSVGADRWWWDFGDDSMSVAFAPVHYYSTPGSYEVTLIASNACHSDTAVSRIDVDYTKTRNPKRASLFAVYPNPAQDRLVIHFHGLWGGSYLRLTDIWGRPLKTVEVKDPISSWTWSLSGLSSGLYLVELRDADGSRVVPVIKE